ncbi:MAG: acyl-[acyl-carrier-protein] thioesterase [Candidatus Limimorpha sp.]
MNNFYSEKKKILTAFCDSSLRVNPVKMMTWFEELAEQHAAELNVDGMTIREQHNAFWIIKRVRLEFNEAIREHDEVTLKTWPSGTEGLRCLRNYQISKEDGTPFVNALAEWVILDCETRRPRYADSINFPKIDFIKEKAVNTHFRRFKDIFSEDDFVYDKKIRAFDIDLSHHTNNVRYCMMILDTFSVSELESMDIKELEICYEAESLEGDTLRIYRKEIDNGWQFAIKRNGKTITSAFIGK